MRVTLLATFLLSLLPASARAQAEFERLGSLTGGRGYGYGWGLSADGSAIAAESEDGGTHLLAVRWTEATGMEYLGDLSGAEIQGYARGISPDGGWCVGASRTQDDSYWQWHAFRQDSTGMIDLGTLPGVSDGWSFATDASNAGTYVVGTAVHTDNAHLRAFIWSAADGMLPIDPIGVWQSTLANAISADGTIVVGRMTAGTSPDDRAFLWTEANGLLDLGGQEAWGISPDGTMVLGVDDDGAAASWTANDGWVELPWNNYIGKGAVATCADHQVIIGYDAYHGYYWTPEGGTRWIEDVLEDEHGVDLAGWRPHQLEGISDDGTVLVGSAYDTADPNEVAPCRMVVPRTTWERLGHAMAGQGGVESQLYGRGDLAAGGRGFLAVEKGRGNAPVLFIVGASALYVPLFKGTLVPSLDLIVPAQLGWYGDVSIGGALDPTLPPGIEFHAQAWILDPAAPKGFSATNAMKGVTQ